jgi:hypothetical protein
VTIPQDDLEELMGILHERWEDILMNRGDWKEEVDMEIQNAIEWNKMTPEEQEAYQKKWNEDMTPPPLPDGFYY